MKRLPSFERKRILLEIASLLKSREEELSRALTVEVGKPIKDSHVEVSRAIDTFTVAAEESVRREGQFAHLDISQRNKGFSSITDRFPIGLISMITPFNFPINLAAHKIAPAIAAGCPFLVKPSERTPLASVLLGEILSKCSLPEGAFSILPCELKHAHHFSENENIKLLSFTGSADVGWKLRNSCGRKKVTLELGGNAACVLDEDLPSVDSIMDRLLFGAFYQSGQSCISIQRIYVHEKFYLEFKKKFVDATKKLKRGDPMENDTFLGPLISEEEAKRIELWVNSSGGTILIGGKRDGSFYDATVLENVPKTSKLHCKEVFGPVCILASFRDFKEVIEEVNASSYGLQTGIYTQNLNKAFYAFNELVVGGVIINDIPSARVDSQPYGGVKESGIGREGIKYAIEEFTELKLMLLKDVGLQT